MIFQFLSGLSPHEKRMTAATYCTILRILLTPFIVGAMLADCWYLAGILFLGASLTDVADGLLARWRDERTLLGAVLDPVADKFLMGAVFCTLVFAQSPMLPIPWWLVLIMVIRDGIIFTGSVVLYRWYGNLEICPTCMGKMTTVLQACFIMVLFVTYFFGWPLSPGMGNSMLAVLVSAALISLWQYIDAGITQVRRSKHGR